VEKQGGIGFPVPPFLLIQGRRKPCSKQARAHLAAPSFSSIMPTA